MPKRFIRGGESKSGTRCEVKICGIIGRDILAASERFQIDIRPKTLRFDPDWQRPQKAQVFVNLLLGDSLTLLWETNMLLATQMPKFLGRSDRFIAPL